MPTKAIYTSTIRRISLRWFNMLAKTEKGVMTADYYSSNVDAGTGNNITKNIYHDVTADTVTDGTAVPIKCIINMEPPKKVAKAMSDWVEGDALPILMFIPYTAGVEPKKHDRVMVGAEEGLYANTWEIKSVKTFARGEPMLWSVVVEPNRS